MSLPQQLNLPMMQTQWASQLNPLLGNPFLQGILLKDITMILGDNVINHLLGRKMQGWVVTDRSGDAHFYRSAPLNNLTLTLTSDSNVTISLYVF